MKKFLSVILFANVLNALAQSGVTISDSILSNGIYRKYRLYKPNIYTGTSAAPLILNLHGYTSNATQQQAYSNFMPVADTANFLMVYPEGTFSNGNQFWNAGFGPGVDDVQFMKDLIDSLSMIYNVDPNRVYSCGMSNGGIMSYYLACNLPDRFAAIASVTGSMLRTWFNCSPGRTVPVMEIHGTGDAVVQYNGDTTFVGIDSVVQKWTMNNMCNPSPVTYSVPDINNSDNSTAINYKYLNGIGGSSVELYKVINGSHSWPGAYPVFANTNEDFSATIEIWRFFRKYTLNMFVTGLKKEEINDRLRIFPNPVKDRLNFSENGDVKIYSLDGIMLKDLHHVKSLDLSDLPHGMYLLHLETGSGKVNRKIVKD
jgi:polyhydroxybutyrate depolymerase